MYRRVYDISPVKVAAVESVDKSLGCSDIRSYGYVMYVAKTKQICLVRFVRFSRYGISEKEEQVDLIA